MRANHPCKKHLSDECFTHILLNWLSFLFFFTWGLRGCDRTSYRHKKPLLRCSWRTIAFIPASLLVFLLFEEIGVHDRASHRHRRTLLRHDCPFRSAQSLLQARIFGKNERCLIIPFFRKQKCGTFFARGDVMLDRNKRELEQRRKRLNEIYEKGEVTEVPDYLWIILSLIMTACMVGVFALFLR